MNQAEHDLSDLAQLENPSVIMMVGVPASGKSYIAEQLGALLTVGVLSSDECRRELSGDPNDQSVSRDAWLLVYQRAQEAIDEGYSVIIDGTHNQKKGRRRDIARYKRFGAKAVIGVHVTSSFETTKARNTARERVVPEFVMERMLENLYDVPPTTDDGFDYVVTVDNN